MDLPYSIQIEATSLREADPNPRFAKIKSGSAEVQRNPTSGKEQPQAISVAGPAATCVWNRVVDELVPRGFSALRDDGKHVVDLVVMLLLYYKN